MTTLFYILAQSISSGPEKIYKTSAAKNLHRPCHYCVKIIAREVIALRGEGRLRYLQAIKIKYLVEKFFVLSANIYAMNL